MTQEVPPLRLAPLIMLAIIVFCIALQTPRAGAQRVPASSSSAPLPTLVREERVEANAVDASAVQPSAAAIPETPAPPSRRGASGQQPAAQAGQAGPSLSTQQVARGADVANAALAAGPAPSAVLNTSVQFDGFTEPEAGSYPPDPNLAVSNNHVLVMSTFSWKALDRAGNVVRPATRFDAWFQNTGVPGDRHYYYFNPKVTYRDGHFYMAMVWFNSSTSESRIFVSVSRTADPNGAWCNFTFNGMAGGDGRGGSGAYADYPNIGISGNGFYIATDHFSLGVGGYQLTTLWTFRRSDLENCNGTIARQYTDFFNEDGYRSFVLQPAVDYDAGGDNAFYMINSFAPFQHVDFRTTVWRLNNPFGANPVWSRWTLNTGRVSGPPQAPQPGTTAKLSTFDSTMLNAVRRNGVLWTVQSTGIWNPAGNCVIIAIYWMAVTAPSSTNPGTAPSLQQDGYYHSGSCNDAYFLPAISVAADGSTGIVFNRSGTNVYAEIRYTGRRPSDPVGTLAPSKLLIASPPVTDTRWRWGSYSSATADPADPSKLWFAAEYLKGQNSWGMRVGQVQISDGNSGQAMPAISSQPRNVSVAPGQPASFSVTATGSAPLSYQWQRNGANISGATNSTYTLPSATTGDNGARFRVIVSNQAGSVTSNEAVLTVGSATPTTTPTPPKTPTPTSSPCSSRVCSTVAPTATPSRTPTPCSGRVC
jgi:hypothetical protein